MNNISARKAAWAGGELPYKKRLLWLQSGTNSLINTGIDLFDSTDFEMLLRFEPVAFYNYVSLWTESDDSYESWIYGDGNLAIRVNHRKVQPLVLALNNVYDLTIKGTGANSVSGSVNSVQFSFTQQYGACNEMKLFGGYNNIGGRWRFYKLPMVKNGVAVRSYIPVIDYSDIVCMYDEVTGAFFYNQGTDSFIAGPEI